MFFRLLKKFRGIKWTSSYKRCAEKLSSDSYAEKYYVIVILNKLYTYIRYNLLKIENHGKKLFMKGTPHAV